MPTTTPVTPMSRKNNWLTGRLEHLLSCLALLSYGAPVKALLGICLMSGLMLVSARTLGVDADLTELLPPNFSSVQDLDKLKERFGGVGFMIVVGMEAEPEVLRRFADDFAPKMEALSSIRYVDYHRPKQFFLEHGLYFLDVEDLQTVATGLTERVTWERNKRNPLFLDMEDGGDEPPALDFSEMENKYSSNGSDTGWMSSQISDSHYIDVEKRLIAIMGKPTDLSTDLIFTQKVVDEVDALVAGLDMSLYPGLKIGYCGRYAKRIEQQRSVQRDLKISTIAALLLMLLYLVYHFRRLAAVGLILLPLAVGLIWTFGLTALIFGSLNILTGFIGAILLGLGIDHGIHLLSRYEMERQGGARSSLDAVTATFGDTGLAVVVAALTTTVAFGGLGFSEFRAFREFGLIAAMGMVFVVLAYSSMLPALLSLLERTGWRARHRTFSKSGLSCYVNGLIAHPKRVVLGGLLIVLLSAIGWSSLTFDYDFAKLESSDLPTYVLDLKINKVLGYSQNPVVVLTESIADERAISAAFREMQKLPNTTIDLVLSGADLIPTQQQEKEQWVHKIGKALKRAKRSMVPEEYRAHLKDAKRAGKAKPFTRDALPADLKRQFQGIDAKPNEGFVLVFPNILLSDGAEVARFADELRSLKLDTEGPLAVSGEAMILADILQMVYREAPPVLLATLLAVFCTMWLLLGSLLSATLCLLPAVVTLLTMFGIAGFVGVDFNYLNMIMVPVIFGIGVDGGVHYVTRLLGDHEAHTFGAIVTETGHAVSGAMVTTGLGFGALLLADHAGLNSLGLMALLGLAINLVASNLWLPAVLRWIGIRRLSAATADGQH